MEEEETLSYGLEEESEEAELKMEESVARVEEEDGGRKEMGQ